MVTGGKIWCFFGAFFFFYSDFNFCFSEWISVDKDETGGPKGKPTLVSRLGHEYVKSVLFPSEKLESLICLPEIYVFLLVYLYH